jgi:hypothetical protein
MNKKISIFLAVIIIVLFAGFFIWVIWHMSKIEVKTVPDKTYKTPNIVKEDFPDKEIFADCIQKAQLQDEKAIESSEGDVKPARGNYFFHYAIDCIGQAAVSKKDSSFCSNEEGMKTIDKAWIKLLSPLFNKSDEESTPSNIALLYGKEKCLLDFMIGTVETNGFDPQKCQSFSNEDIKNDCLKTAAHVNKDENVCLEIFDVNTRDDCYRILATDKTNPDICSKISNEYIQNNCFQLFAYRNHDELLCDRLKGESKYCKESLNMLKNNTIEVCNNMKSFDGSSPGDESCLFAFAIFNKDLEICSKYKGTGPFVDDICERYAK